MRDTPKGFVSYIAHEADLARLERINRRIAFALVISLLVNVALAIAILV